MSALGQSRRFRDVRLAAALPPTPDIRPMQRITIRRERTWHWTRMRRWVGQSSVSHIRRGAPPMRSDMIFGMDTGFLEIERHDRVYAPVEERIKGLVDMRVNARCG
jgi:hypothetical protein